MWQVRFSPLSLGPRLLRSALFLSAVAILREADFEMPTWTELADGARPNQPENPEDEPTDSTHGWQRDATLKLETKFFQEQFWPILSEPEQAQMRSQSGPMSSEPFTSFPTSREARFDSQRFRVLLLRRLRLHLPLNVRRCRCGRLLDPIWPPPFSERGCGGFGEERFRFGVCRGEDVP